MKKIYILAILIILLAIINIAETLNNIKMIMDRDREIADLKTQIFCILHDPDEQLKQQEEN